MTQYNILNVKLFNSQLNKVKFAIKNGTEVSLNLSSNLIRHSNDETKIPHKILLTDTQVSKICKAFANDSLANIKLSKTQLSKIMQSGGFLTSISSVTSSLENIFKFPFKVMNSYSNEINNRNNNNKKIRPMTKLFL